MFEAGLLEGKTEGLSISVLSQETRGVWILVLVARGDFGRVAETFSPGGVGML